MAARPASGTRTHTITLDPPSASSSSSSSSESLVLRLRPPKKKVQWKEGTIDNEHMNKKKSNKCCIFHKEKPFDEDYSDDDEGSTPGTEDLAAMMLGAAPMAELVPTADCPLLIRISLVIQIKLLQKS